MREERQTQKQKGREKKKEREKERQRKKDKERKTKKGRKERKRKLEGGCFYRIIPENHPNLILCNFGLIDPHISLH